ncbi:MAG: prepilin-type N-terminal cleavage/methylation domain-containing protein [Epsilonproteobacteria bacterium]|nr:prepilin-type N-terminal cleavage/methylation domain-containing protein [Campylobacterota bacterium]
MNRRAFTLIELMVSIALTTIVVFFLYKALSNQERATEILAKNANELSVKDKLFQLLFLDLSQAQEVKIQHLFNKDYKILTLKTSNSLHQIPFPYVSYFVHERNRTLVRLESAYPIKFPVEFEQVKKTFADPLVSDVKKFIVIDVMQGGGLGRELLPGERPPPKKKKEDSSKEYLLFLKWKKDRIIMDVKK